MMKLKLGSKGEIVIPKKIREQLGLSKESTIILEVKDKYLILKTTGFGENIVKKWEERAKKYNAKVSTEWIYGDKLYEEIYGIKE